MHITRLLNTLIAFIVTSMTVSATSPRRPDFAFPEKVSAEAEKNLVAALASGNEVGALRAALNLTLAQNAIDSDRMPASLARLDSMTRKFDSPAPRAVCNLIRASIYSAYFRSQQWNIERRPALPAGTEPSSDYTEWNATQFEAAISELLNSTMANPDALLATPLRDYDPLLDISAKNARIEYTFYPSLLDFIAGQAIDIISAFHTPSARTLAAEYRATLIRLNKNNPAPFIMSRISGILSDNTDGNTMRSDLLKLYNDMSDSQFSGEVLITLGSMTDYNDIDQCRSLKGLIDSYLKKYPAYLRANSLKNILANISRRRVSVDYRSLIVPGNMLTLKAVSYNTPEAVVTLYRLPDSYKDNGDEYYNINDGIPSTLKPVGSRRLSFSGSSPFRAEVSDSIMIDSFGLYIAVVQGSGLRSNTNPRIIRATALATGSLTFGPSVSAWVVNPLTGQPVDRASVLRIAGKTTSDIGLTDTSGMLALDSFNPRGMKIKVRKGADIYSSAMRLWNSGNRLDTTRHYYAEAYTGLALYHPGDSVQFAAMVYSLKDQQYRVEPELDFSATLYDANRQPVDTVTGLVTDRYGRISGSFLLPDDGRLNGQYFICIESHGVRQDVYFTVSDYKLPSFEVSVTETATDTPTKGAVTLRGKAMTYSGMPLQNAGIDIKVSRTMMWRRWQPDNNVFQPLELSTTTSDNGEWSIEISPSQLAAAGKNTWFEADITATSSAGESRATRAVFTLGPAIRIEAPLASSYDVAKPITLPVKAVNTANDRLSGIKISYTITPDGKRDDAPVASGSFMSDRPEADWSAVAPGLYDITFTAEGDTTLCQAIALYRPDINRSPSTELIWTPSHDVTLGIDGTTDLLIGTSMDTTYLLYTLYDYESIIERRVIVLPAGIHTIQAKTQRGGTPGLRASFIAAGRYTSLESVVNINPAIDPRGLKLRIESMRDRVVPGSEERWTFSVVNALGTPVEAAIMTDLYNKALDALTPHRWRLNVNAPQSLSLNFRNPEAGYPVSAYLSATRPSGLRETSYSLPEFQLYGRTLGPQTFRSGIMIHGHGVRMMKAAATVDVLKTEDAVVEEAEQEVMMDYATAGAAPAPMDGGTLEENAVTAEDADDAAAPDNAPQFMYRDAGTPLALFRPMLATGPDGKMTLSVTMPDANATWALQAIAWTDDMRTARLDTSVIASKPVMIKPNTPRFLREGDSTVILTSVMNATDSAMTAAVDTEVFDPVSGRTLSKSTDKIEIAPKSTATVSTVVDATPGCNAIGFRAKASTPMFADGEQTVIPVLQATVPVIDSKPFYMGSDTHEAKVVLPAAKDASDAVTTLEFCENPVWYVVTALPGLSAKDPLTSPQAADALFSAAVARGLIDRYPVIAETLRDWTTGGSSSTELTSMLERNEDLKNMLLTATPWVADALSDTERMQRLALLFDRNRVNKSISSSIDLLKKLSRKSGGWAWIDRMDETSYWATTRVLSLLASLDEYGFTPDDSHLAAMTADAVSYLDSEAAKSYRKDPSAPQVSYAMLRASFPTIKADATAEKIMVSATQAVVKDWKQWALSSKPEAAMLLWRRDYKTVAKDILASMREYMVITPDKGSCFPSLQNQATGYLSYTADALRAFAAIEPGCPEIDGLRHWLVVQKQATDWGSSAYATEVVTAILSSSQSWLGDASGSAVKVNGREVSVPATDRRLGYFRMPVEVSASKDVTVTIDKPADTPAWGAVMRRAIQPLRSVEAAGLSDLSIEKSIIGVSDSLKTGDKVTVRLVIRAGRNLNYVAVTDDRAACFEPVEQLPSVQFSEGVGFYLEPRDSRTDIFITTMPKGTYVLSYDVYVNNAGSFASGIATVSSQYAPELTARSAGSVITVNQ